MSEQHAESPASAADGSAVTQPLPSPAEVAAAAARVPASVGTAAPAAVATAFETGPAGPAGTAGVSDATQPLPPPPPKQHPVHRPPTAMIAALAAGVLIVGAVLVVLVGRIGRGHDPRADAAPRTFPSPQALVDYLDRRGLPCSGYEAVDAAAAGAPVRAVGRGRCTAAGRPVGVGVYAGHDDVEAQWSAESGPPGHGPLFMALGENWTIDGPAEWTRRVAEVMSAQFRSQP